MRPECGVIVAERSRPPFGGRAQALFFRATPAPLRWLAARLGRWVQNARQRAMLARMDDRMLRDVGLDRATAREESGKWFWQW